jgi:hypothetical protein
MREGVADSPWIAAIWVSKSQSYNSCPNNSRYTHRPAIDIWTAHRVRNRPESLHQHVSWSFYVPSSARGGNTVLPSMEPGFTPRTSMTKSDFRTMKILKQLNSRRSAAENNVDRRAESVWIPFGHCSAQAADVDEPIL